MKMLSGLTGNRVICSSIQRSASLDVVQLADEIGLRGRSVVQREHAEPKIGEMRVEIAVELFVSVGESAAMDVYVHRQCVAATHDGIAWDVGVE